MRPIALALLLTLLWQAPTALAQAQSAPVLQVRQFGWQADGALSSASWNPVTVHLGGARTESVNLRLQVVLRVSMANSGPRGSFATLGAYGQDVALPPGVEKDVRLWVYLPVDGAYVGSVQLLTSNGQVVAEDTVQGQAARADIPLVGTLADAPTLAAQLGQIEVPYQQGLTAQVRTIGIAASDMPPRADYLQAFRGLALQGAAPAALTGEQRRAVQEWVIQGGHLLILGGPDASRAVSVLDGSSAPPIRFGAIDGVLDLHGLADWVSPGAALASGTAARIEGTAGDTLAGPGRPLAQRAAWGQGSLTLLAADPTLDPLRGWPGTPLLLRRAIEPALAADRTTPGDPLRQPQGAGADDLRLAGALDALPPQMFPDWQHVGLLLVGFALLAGPVLHVVLWRADRRPLLWIAVPALSLLFSVVIYLASGAVPGRDIVANVVSEIRLDPRSNDARQAVAVGFFAPLRPALTVRSAGELPVRVWSGSLSGMFPISSGLTPGVSAALGAPLVPTSLDAPYRVTTGRETEVEFPPNAAYVGGLRSLVFSHTLSSAGHFEADLHVEGTDGLIRGSVRNATPYPLDQVALGIGLNLVNLGPLAPGQTVPVNFDPRATPPTAPGNVVYPLAWQMFGTPTTAIRAAVAPALDLPSDPDLRRRLRLVDAVLARGDRARNVYAPTAQPYQHPTPTAPMLIALCSAVIGEDALPSAGAQRTFELSVLEQPVQLPIAPGRFKLVPNLLPPTATVAEPGASVSNPYYPGYGGGATWVEVRDGAVTYTFRADLPAGTRVDALTVKTVQSSAQMATPPAPPGPGPATIPHATDSAAPAATGAFSVFNWQSNSWDPLSSGATETTIGQPAHVIGPNGAVRVQVTSGGKSKTLRFQVPELTIDGEAPR